MINLAPILQVIFPLFRASLKLWANQAPGNQISVLLFHCLDYGN